MQNLTRITLAGICLLGMNWSVAGQDKEVRAIIDKAIRAHGGADKLAKFPAAHIKAKGHLEFMKLKFTIEIHTQNPDKTRTSVDIDLNGKNLNVVNVFDGKKAWESIMGQTKEEKDEKKLKRFKTDTYARHVSNLIPLTGKEFELSSLGEAKVKEQDAVGVRISAKDKPDVNLYFDKTTGLLAKSEHRTTDPFNGNEVTQETFFSDYKETDGMPAPRKLVVHHDGKFFMEVEIAESRRLEAIDKAIFAQP